MLSSNISEFQAHLNVALAYKNKLVEINQQYIQRGENVELAIENFTTHKENIYWAQEWSAREFKWSAEVAEICAEFPRGGAEILLLRLTPEQQVQWLESAISAAHFLKQSKLEQAHTVHLGTAYLFTGNAKAAIKIYQKSLRLIQKLKKQGEEIHPGAIGVLLCNIGIAYSNLGKINQSIDFLEQYLDVGVQIGDKNGQLGALLNLGNAYNKIGNYETAIDYSQKALSLAKELHNLRFQSFALNGLGNIYMNKGLLEDAAEFYRESLKIKESLKDISGIINTYLNLGNLFVELKQFDAARNYLEFALNEVAENTKDVRVQSKILGALGNLYENMEDLEKAYFYYEDEYRTSEIAQDKIQTVGALLGLSSVLTKSGKIEEAKIKCSSALSLSKQIKNKIGEGNAHFISSLIQFSSGNYQKAVITAQKALKIFEKIGDAKSDKVRAKLAEWSN